MAKVVDSVAEGGEVKPFDNVNGAAALFETRKLFDKGDCCDMRIAMDW